MHCKPWRPWGAKHVKPAAALALLVCATPAAAQTMSIESTLDYINQRCQKSGSSGEYHHQVSLYNNQIALMKWQSPTPGYRPNSIGSTYRYTIHLFDLRRVDIERFSAAIQPYAAYFTCGVIDCISGESYWSETRVHLKTVGEVKARGKVDYQPSAVSTVAWENCREPDRVFNAFKHLQNLLGGRMTDPVDPFAN